MFEPLSGKYLFLAVLGVSSSVVVGLIAVWAALARRPHWSIRCAFLLGIISLGLLIPAHELVAMFFVQSAVVIGALNVSRMFQRQPDGKRRGFQFSLLDILLLTVLTAWVMAAFCSAPSDTWTVCMAWFFFDYGAFFSAPGTTWDPPGEIAFYLMSGALCGFTTLIGCWAVLSKKRIWIKLSVLAFTFALAIMAHYSHNYGCDFASYWPYIFAANAVITAVWIFLARGSIRRADPSSKLNAGRWIFRLACVALSLAILLPAGGTLYFMATPPPIPEVELPEPNAYDTFARVGRELVVVPVPDLSALGPNPKQILAAFEQKSKNLIAEARAALSQECRVPLVYAENRFDVNLPDLQALRVLARGFVAQGHLSHLHGDNDMAVECYLETIRLGKSVARGGLLIDMLVGVAIEGLGQFRLYEIKDSLTDVQLAELAKKIHALQAPGEPLEEFEARDEIACYYMFGWEGRLDWMVTKALEFVQVDSGVLKYTSNRSQSRYRVLLIEIALTQYRNKHGKYPDKLDMLVGEFLDELPGEPDGADVYVYRLKKSGYELYSLGENRHDDGGDPANTNNASDDVGF